MKEKLLLCFAASTAASFAITAPLPAAAVVRQYSANICMFETDFIGDYIAPGTTISNQSGSRARIAHCPLVDDDTLNHKKLGIVEIDGNDADSTHEVSAQSCQVPWSGGAVQCGAWRGSGVSFQGGQFQILTDLSALNGDTFGQGYAFVNISLFGQTSVRGIFTSGTGGPP